MFCDTLAIATAFAQAVFVATAHDDGGRPRMSRAERSQ